MIFDASSLFTEREKMFHSLIKGFILSLFIFLWLAGLTWASESQKPPKAAPKDKCPVCGMFITKYPDWTGIVLFRDGSRAFFDGPKDLFKYLLDLKRYNPLKKKEDVENIWVNDYYTLSPIKAKEAWYVLGSDIYGPMGHELIPLEKESEAKAFLKDHKGKRILKFSDVSTEVIKTLD
jgi:copper chaperone NosL